MLYAEENVKNNIRNREGKRVFYLQTGDTLTPSARDYLNREKIEILPASLAKPSEFVLLNGSFFKEKPETYTHLRSNVLVPKTHPVIAFRGKIDTLEAELLLAQLAAPESFRQPIGEILGLTRKLIRWDVLEEPASADKLCGLTQEEQRIRSHRPQDFFGQPHFMPEYTDGAALLQLNRARCAAREAELAAVHAFADREGNPTRADLLTVMNRISSMIYILMIRMKAGK